MFLIYKLGNNYGPHAASTNNVKPHDTKDGCFEDGHGESPQPPLKFKHFVSKHEQCRPDQDDGFQDETQEQNTQNSKKTKQKAKKAKRAKSIRYLPKNPGPLKIRRVKATHSAPHRTRSMPCMISSGLPASKSKRNP